MTYSSNLDIPFCKYMQRIQSSVACGCFHTAGAEGSGCNRDLLQILKYLMFSTLEKKS